MSKVCGTNFLLFILNFLLFSSCKHEEEDVITHIYNATIKVSVYHQIVKPSGDFENIPIDDALIELYKTEYDLQNNLNLVLALHSDSNGLATFYNLKEKYYYIRASHPTYGTQLEETGTPDGTTSFVDFIF